MIQKNSILPTESRFMRMLAKSRIFSDKSLLPDMGEVLRVRSGSKVSRYFRLILERVNIRKLLGTNLAFIVIASGFTPLANQPQLIDSSGTITGETDIVMAPIVLKTEMSIRYPVENVIITQGYRFYHPGIDLDGITGEPIYPIMSGDIEAVSYSRVGYGKTIVVKHKDNKTSLYAHLSQILVEKGQKVTTKSVIGKMGATGKSSGDHLHLEIRESNRPVNPINKLPVLN